MESTATANATTPSTPSTPVANKTPGSPKCPGAPKRSRRITIAHHPGQITVSHRNLYYGNGYDSDDDFMEIEDEELAWDLRTM
jgi:hypothetical protein